ncbi:hypothetical protein PG988_011602 [Apiospora saccharicola]
MEVDASGTAGSSAFNLEFLSHQAISMEIDLRDPSPLLLQDLHLHNPPRPVATRRTESATISEPQHKSTTHPFRARRVPEGAAQARSHRRAGRVPVPRARRHHLDQILVPGQLAGGDDAFARLALHSPQLTVADPECPTPEIKLRPTKRVTFIRVGGDPDILKRAEEDHFSFLTVPPVGQGHAEVVWELSPATLLRKMGNPGESVQDKLLRLLRPGDTYRIWPGSMTICWWSFGSLEDEAGDGLDDKKKKKKVARWTLPDGLPLVRAPGVDETEDVAHRLVDLVDHHNVNFLSSRSAVEDEQIPVIKDMRAEGWVFGEPRAGLKMVVRDQGGEAVFTITE